jgi:hypothetical protein
MSEVIADFSAVQDGRAAARRGASDPGPSNNPAVQRHPAPARTVETQEHPGQPRPSASATVKTDRAALDSRGACHTQQFPLVVDRTVGVLQLPAMAVPPLSEIPFQPQVAAQKPRLHVLCADCFATARRGAVDRVELVPLVCAGRIRRIDALPPGPIPAGDQWPSAAADRKAVGVRQAADPVEGRKAAAPVAVAASTDARRRQPAPPGPPSAPPAVGTHCRCQRSRRPCTIRWTGTPRR